MTKFNPADFIKALQNKMRGRGLPACPYCGGNKFTTTENIATILIGTDIEGINIGPHIPCGMIVCEQCGHMEFFALGALGLMKGDSSDNGK